MPQTYNQRGLRFLYPDNWELEDGETIDGMPSATVYAPCGGFWSVTLGSSASNVQELTVAALESLRSEYAESEAEPGDDLIEGVRLTGFNVSFYYVDLTSTATIRGFKTPTGCYLILAQAEDHDFQKLEAVFLAMTTSLVQSMVASERRAASERPSE